MKEMLDHEGWPYNERGRILKDVEGEIHNKKFQPYQEIKNENKAMNYISVDSGKYRFTLQEVPKE